MIQITKGSSIWLVLLSCFVNLLIMHYYILLTSGLGGGELTVITIANNIFGIIVDVCLLFLFAYEISRHAIKFSLIFCFCVTLVWSFSNVLYSRFFQHYITFSAIGQGSSLFDSLMLRILIDGISCFDCYYIFAIVAFCFLIRNNGKNNWAPPKISLKILMVLLTAFLINVSCYMLWCAQKPEWRYLSYFTKMFDRRHFSKTIFLINPKNANFERGSVRSLITELCFSLQGKINLEDGNKMNIIRKEIDKSKLNNSYEFSSDQNVIMIIVESYMSFTSDMLYKGKEVTPFLNYLKRDPAVYYNGSVKENITIGESSDGQYIYMTGLLPLRSVITVSKACHVALPGLPKKLGKESRMIIPSIKSVWLQEDMCRQYGFNYLYASNDYEGTHDSNLNDEQVFRLAMGKDKTSKKPFFSVILTMSMHQPYTKQIDSSFPINDRTIPSDLACYLNVCHYTDSQIKKYFDHLKKIGLYDNSLIIITADHRVHNTDFGGVDEHIPLYIRHPTINRDEMWKGECNQLDVYTTILDLVGCKGSWFGLGRSLASKQYTNTLTGKTWDVSEWIIMGDYFGHGDSQ